MATIVYGLGRTRITLYLTGGTIPTDRYTLQREGAKGMTLTFSPMGVATVSGSEDHWGKRTNLKGFRPSLKVSWGYGIISSHETWNGSAFVPTASVDTHVAVAKILNSAANQPCLVEPRTSDGYSFLAQPEMAPFNLTDTKGIAYKGVEILLVGTRPTALPTWGV